MNRRITLEAWIARTYDQDGAPSLKTVRRWARDNKLEPPAVKEGRTYYVDAAARYTPATRERSSLVDRINAANAEESRAS